MLRELFACKNIAAGKLFRFFFSSRYLAHAPSIRFSILSFDISKPYTNESFEKLHFDKSPAFPTAKSIRVSPGLDAPLIMAYLTTLL